MAADSERAHQAPVEAACAVAPADDHGEKGWKRREGGERYDPADAARRGCTRASQPRHLPLCAPPAPIDDTNASRCVFTPGAFALDAAAAVLRGLDAWEARSGATLTLACASSSAAPSAYPTRRTNLRLAAYVHLALLLEQHFLLDSGVKLQSAPPPSTRCNSVDQRIAGTDFYHQPVSSGADQPNDPSRPCSSAFDGTEAS
ncbi:hypothetical protein FB451DRAFT_1413223 [Mycena latifolia]|nr:hypothetical protein FB451DRAFT_1413223 [Mycena latifolia]